MDTTPTDEAAKPSAPESLPVPVPTPAQVADPILITIAELIHLIDAGAPVLILDVRTQRTLDQSDSTAAHSIRIEPDLAIRDAQRRALPHDTWLVAFCACPHEETSTRVVEDLHRAGWPQARALVGGWDGYQAAGLPIEKRPGAVPAAA